ncbi:DNA-directed DNA polymerase [Chlorobium limicola DSM 245]|uniref:DNA-directed DNA polymerase n=1 Tax=Chlorobium limicola (strain DSM 245 / NBRC 103803 / 6330) TaxID=290315 RepID=B3EF44_CHLL2|nr:DNA polymerase III subunit delta' [Chlorobium limicola]ACD90906.1 DNA-directed DNA polymerase [Chlorobium limicola DSM 245]
MSWKTIIGQKQQIRVLQKALETGRLAHAYLFTGPEASGKESVAFELARTLNCRNKNRAPETGSCGTCPDCMQIDSFMHANIEYIFPVEAALLDSGESAKKENKKFSETKERYEALLEEKKLNPYLTPAMERSMGILSEQIVTLQQKALYRPSEGQRKIFIISQADRMNPAAANKILKLLEEPPAHILFILISSRPEAVLPTIRSRCQIVRFQRPGPMELRKWIQENRPDIHEPELGFIVSFSRGNLALAWDLINQGGVTGNIPVIQLRNQALDYLRLVLTPSRLHEALSACESHAKNLSKTELPLFLGALLLFLQDVNHRLIDPEFQTLNNPDIAASIDRFAKNFPTPDFLAISTITEEAIRAIDRNANPLLVLAAWTSEIKNLILAKSQ